MTKASKRKARQKFVKMMRSTLEDLQRDLQNSKIEGADDIKRALEEKPETRVIDLLKDHESYLYKALPISVLQQSDKGKAYLDILRLVTEFPVSTPVQKVNASAEVDSAPLETITTEGAQRLTEGLPDAIHELANDFQSKLQLPEDVSQINIMDVFQQVTQMMDQKQQAGELDMNMLQEQAGSFLSQIQSQPEVQQLLLDPTLLMSAGGMSMEGIMSMMQTPPKP